MSEIIVDRECFYNDANRIIQHLDDLTLPELAGNNCCNFASLEYYQAIYNQLKYLIDVYKRVLSRDVCAITDMAIAFIEYDNLCADLTADEHWFPEVEADLNASEVSVESYVSVTISHDSSSWDYSLDVMWGVLVEILSNIECCISNLEHMVGHIHRFRDTEGFRGEAAYASLLFFNSNHVNCVYALHDTLVVVNDYIANHYLQYKDIGVSIISKEDMDNLIRSLNDEIDSMNNLEPSLMTAHDEVRVASGVDYSTFLPDKSRIINLCEETISSANSIIDYVNDTEETFFAGQVQPNCDTVLSTCFGMIQTVINDAGRLQYINPPVYGTDSLGIGASYLELNSLCCSVNLDYSDSFNSVLPDVLHYIGSISEEESFVERGRNYLEFDREGVIILVLYCLGYGDVNDDVHFSNIFSSCGTAAELVCENEDLICEGIEVGHHHNLNISNAEFSQYMMADDSLKCYVRRIIDNYISSEDISVGESIDIDYTCPMEIENGEGIVGYQFLHGTVDSAGGFQITGSIYRQSEDVFVCDLTCTWNDQIDTNGTYTSDRLKNILAEMVFQGEPEAYDIHITWESQTVIDVNTPANSTGWLRTPAEDFSY